MTTPLGTFGLPPDPAAWCALLLGLGLLGLGTWPDARAAARRVAERHPALLVAAAGVAAAALSAAYVAIYLRGGPRIIDATSYFLQARALAGGALAFEVPDPPGSFTGRFLVGAPDGGVSVIFPPGYPAILASGFLLGFPLAVGPAIAAALVMATYAAGRRLFPGDPLLPLLAAGLSVVSAALRYHTADTMSHGWSALLFIGALWGALGRGAASAAIAGLAAGWLIATRPVSGLWAAAVTVALCSGSRPRLAAMLAGTVPGVSLLLAHQHAATGSWLGSSQLAYYAVADGPPGCFRYGFGPGVGCLYEHGDFVRARLEAGFGAMEAAGTTLRRLKMHLVDPANALPLTLLVPWAIIAGRSERSVRRLAVAVAGLMAAYAPFYFDGNYPGGGARFYADVLPLEQLLIAWALVRLKLCRFALPVALAGFALHASHDHIALAQREGGRPMFESAALARAGIERGLVFVDTDHGFNLGFDPLLEGSAHGPLIARLRRDAHDRLLWEQQGRPPTFHYRYLPTSDRSVPRLQPYLPAPSSRYEAEAFWPALEVRGGWVHPMHAPCASQGRGLRLRRAGRKPVEASFHLFVPHAGSYALSAGRIGLPGDLAGEITILVAETRWELAAPARDAECSEQQGPVLQLPAGRLRMTVRATRTDLLLDYIRLDEALQEPENL